MAHARWLRMSGAGLAAYTGLAADISRAFCESGPPIFSFGVIADIQYAPIEDATNFSGSERRYYRGALEATRQAVESWNSMPRKIAFVAQLGDLIDGQNAGGYGQGLTLPKNQSEMSMKAVMEELLKLDSSIAIYHTIGNHELYNFNSSQLRQHLNIPLRSVVSEGNFYFSISPVQEWRILVLNAYEVSLMLSKEEPGYHEAARLIRKHNPNDVIDGQGNVNYFEGLTGDAMRFVPFNGGFGDAQLQWLEQQVRAACMAGEKVVIMSHIPIHPGSASFKTVTFDYDRALRILHEVGQGCVVAIFAGHHHEGGYTKDEHGIHHVTVQSPLTHGESFGHVDVHPTHLDIVGKGALPSRKLAFQARYAL